MQFSTEVKSAHWQESSSTWLLQLSRLNADGSTTIFTDECDILLQASGVLNKFKWPAIKGIDKFKGKVIHTARWEEKYQEQEWKEDHVAIIGSGASSIQTVPKMQPFVKHMDIFIRTPVWFVEIAGNDGKNIECECYLPLMSKVLTPDRCRYHRTKGELSTRTTQVNRTC